MRCRWRLLLAMLASLGLESCSSPGGPSVVLLPAPSGGVPQGFEARGLDRVALERAEGDGADWGAAFQVFVDDAASAAAAGTPSLLGTVERQGDALRFTPQYPLVPGLRYRARLRSGPWLGGAGDASPPLESSFALEPRVLVPRIVVDHVYPTASVLPENQLKFYIHFSGPMRRGYAYSSVRLLDAAGTPVEDPFLELGEELWDPQGRRFTLFFDPGRIKRGLLPHDEVGPCLERGKRYTLVVGAAWLDADGAPLVAEHRKVFDVGPPDYEQPDPRSWTLSPLRAGSKAALVVAFPEPMDQALTERLLHVRGPGGAELAGRSTVAPGEREWRFEPETPWQAGRHELAFERILEDLAGNSVDRPFEVDTSRGIESRIVPAIEVLPFAVEAVP